MNRSAIPARLAGALLVLAAGAVFGGTASADAAPYHDPHAAGSITLCGKDGQPVTSGSIHTQPFVWRAVASQPAAVPYNGSDAVVSLQVYLPRKGYSPLEWVGVPLTAVSEFSQTAHPMAQATILDPPLSQFSDQVDVRNWNGYLQLRMLSAGPGLPTNTNAYPTADIHIVGDTWTLVAGGSDSCGSATDAKSKETYLATYDKLVKQAERKQSQSSASTSPTSTASDQPSGGTGPSATNSAPTAAASAGGTETAGGAWIPLVGGLVVLGVVLAGAAVWWRTARR